jgi:hypothetical protein
VPSRVEVSFIFVFNLFFLLVINKCFIV